MEKEIFKTETWLPIFQGFYGTFFESDDYQVEEDIKDFYADDDALCNKALDFFWSSEESTRAEKEYKERIVNDCTNFIAGEFKEFTLPVIKSLKLQELVSPKEYNFYNDSINIEIEYTEENLENIENAIKENFEQWRQYLKDRYTSYDGFWSSHSNNANDEEWQIKEAMQDSHKAGAILDFLLWWTTDFDDNQEMLMSMLDYIAGNGGTYLSIDIEAFDKELKEHLENE